MKSLLFQPGAVFTEPALCTPGRQEVVVSFRKDGRVYTMTMRDKVVIEDPYLVLVKATAFAIKMAEPYMGRVPPRAVRDVLVKDNVDI